MISRYKNILIDFVDKIYIFFHIEREMFWQGYQLKMRGVFYKNKKGKYFSSGNARIFLWWETTFLEKY